MPSPFSPPITDDRRQMSEDRGPMTEDGKQKMSSYLLLVIG